MQILARVIFSEGGNYYSSPRKQRSFERHKSSYLDGCRETTGVLRGRHYERINVGLPQILKIQFFRKFHNSRSRTDVECTRSSLTLRFQRVAYLPIGERFGFHRYYAEKV